MPNHPAAEKAAQRLYDSGICNSRPSVIAATQAAIAEATAELRGQISDLTYVEGERQQQVDKLVDALRAAEKVLVYEGVAESSNSPVLTLIADALAQVKERSNDKQGNL